MIRVRTGSGPLVGLEHRGLPVAHQGDKRLRIHPQIAEGVLREPADLARRVVDLAGLVLIDRLHPALKTIDAIRRHDDLTLRGKRPLAADRHLPHDDGNRERDEEQGEAGAPHDRAHATTRVHRLSTLRVIAFAQAAATNGKPRLLAFCCVQFSIASELARRYIRGRSLYPGLSRSLDRLRYIVLGVCVITTACAGEIPDSKGLHPANVAAGWSRRTDSSPRLCKPRVTTLNRGPKCGKLPS